MGLELVDTGVATASWEWISSPSSESDSFPSGSSGSETEMRANHFLGKSYFTPIGLLNYCIIKSVVISLLD